MMTASEYEVVADAFRMTRVCIARHAGPLRLTEFDDIMLPRLCDDLQKLNPRFSRDKFMKAVIDD